MTVHFKSSQSLNRSILHTYNYKILIMWFLFKFQGCQTIEKYIFFTLLLKSLERGKKSYNEIGIIKTHNGHIIQQITSGSTDHSP